MRALVFIATGACLLLGCGEGRGVLYVTVEPDGLVTGADHLRVRVDNQGRSATVEIPLPAGDLTEQQFSLSYGPEAHGAFTLTVEAADAAGDSLAQGSRDGTLQPSRRVDVTVVLPGIGATGGDLAGADLTGLDLAGADLAGVDLVGADLAGADLAGAVVVGLTQLDVFAGQPGGPGRLDAVGQQARCETLGQMASDGSGHMFFVDDFALRQLDLATGAVTTPLVPPFLDGFNALAADGQGHLYLGRDFQIVRYEIATGAITPVAGDENHNAGFADGVGSAAAFKGIVGLLLDGAGNLFVADRDNQQVKVVLATSTVSSIGNSTVLNNPQSLALSGGTLFVGDEGGVVQIVLSNSVNTRLAGGPATGFLDGVGTVARFSHVGGVLVESATSLLLRDLENDRLRRLTLGSNEVVTLGVVLHHDPFFVDLAQPFVVEGNQLFTSDGPTLVRFDLPGPNPSLTPVVGSTPQPGLANGAGSQARFSAPRSLASDGKGHLFVADTGNFVIRRVDLASGQVEVFAGSGTSGIADGTGTAAQFSSLHSMTADADHLWVGEGSRLRRISLADAKVETLPITFEFFVLDLEGLASDGQGTVYASYEGTLQNDGRVFKVDVAAGTIAPIGGTFKRPGGLALDGKLLYLSDTDEETIRSIDVTTGDTALVAGSGKSGTNDGIAGTAQFAFDSSPPAALAADGAGHLFVVERDDLFSEFVARVRVIDLATRRVATLAGALGKKGLAQGSLPAALNGPSGIVFVAGQGLFLADELENALVRIH